MSAFLIIHKILDVSLSFSNYMIPEEYFLHLKAYLYLVDHLSRLTRQ